MEPESCARINPAEQHFHAAPPSPEVGGLTDPPEDSAKQSSPIKFPFIFHKYLVEDRITRGHNDNNGEQICEYIALFLLCYIG